MHHELTTERVTIDDLSPYPDNPREGDIGAIAVSLEQNGQFRPIVVNRRDMTILAGNHTWKAAKYLGWSDIAVTFVDVDDQQARKIVLADNRHNDLASYNDDTLAQLLQDIVTSEGVEGLLGTGYDGDDLDTLISDITRNEELPDSFGEVDPYDMDTQYRCPSCTYEWSGSPKPGTTNE